jgi:CheY-like chemotaxis protein
MPYYLYDGKQSIGPFEAGELVKRPEFGAATLVFPVGAAGSDSWKPAGSFPDLASALKPAPLSLTLPEPPRADPAEACAPAAPEPSAPVREEFAPRLCAPSEKLVLVVDDDETVRSFIETCAAMQGFQVVTAVNGIDAMGKLSARRPDLIVTDLMMPGQSGYEFLRSLQAAGNGRIPVFVVTGSVLDKSTIAIIRQEANVVEFIAKPVGVGKFVAALHAHLRTAPKA